METKEKSAFSCSHNWLWVLRLHGNVPSLACHDEGLRSFYIFLFFFLPLDGVGKNDFFEGFPLLLGVAVIMDQLHLLEDGRLARLSGTCINSCTQSINQWALEFRSALFKTLTPGLHEWMHYAKRLLIVGCVVVIAWLYIYHLSCLLTEQQHLDFVAHLHAVAAKLVLNILVSATALLIFLADAATHCSVCLVLRRRKVWERCRVYKARENDGRFGKR